MSEACVILQNVNKTFRLYHSDTWKLLDFFGLPVPKSAYTPFEVFKRLNLTVHKGERLGIIGRNGAGKSTLLNIICGRLSPTGGTVDVQGEIQALMEIGTGFHPEFTGRRNIHASLAYIGIMGKEADRLAEEIIDFSEIGDFIDQPVKIYSAGMYARLAFAVSTASAPDILIIDEVLGVGDARFAIKSSARMHQLTVERGTTVLFVSHDMSAVERICTRACWLKSGEIVMDGDPKDVAKLYVDEITMEEEARLRAMNTPRAAPARRTAPALEREQGAGAPDRDGSGDETATVAEKEEGAAPGKAPLWQETGIPGKMLTADIPVFEAEICDPATLDEKLIFDLGESIGVAVALRSERDLSPCTLACLLFDSLGNVVAVPYAALDKLPKGEHKLAFTIENPNLRTGEYTVSLELYEDFDPCWNKTHRMPFLAYWYRGLSLKIDERRSGTINLGLVKIDASLARLP